MEVSFPTDADGFLSQECLSCEQRFKVLFGEGSDAPVSYCPYCGYRGNDCWYTQAQVNYLEAVATNVALVPEFKKMEQQLKRNSKGFLQIDMKTDLPKTPPPPMEIDEPFDMLHFPCCNETLKLTPRQNHFCIICGTEIDMCITESKKIF